MCAPLAPLHALLSRFAVWKSILATHCVSAAHAIFLVCLEAALAALERLFTAIFDCESRLLSVPPCGVFPSEQSAIVILGDADGVARDVAMNFSELGYTVFLLSPNSATLGMPESSGKSTHVSSLLYVWHKKKEGSSRTSWGMLAPIALDTSSAAQRGHASETIHTFCTNHTLSLVALIVLLPSSPVNVNRFVGRLAITGALGSRGHAFTMREEEIPHPSPLEALSVARDYVDLLVAASGRVVFVASCSDDDYFSPGPLSSRIQQCIATHVGHEWRVRTCSVMTGPLNDTEHGNTGVLMRRIARCLPYSSAEKVADVCRLLESIATSRHPRCSYMLGLHPWLHWAWNKFPDVLQLLISTL